MYYYLKNELQRKSLRYAEVQRNDVIVFVIETNKDNVIEAFFVFKDTDYVFNYVEVNNGNFGDVLRDYIDGTLNGAVQTIQVYHNENVVELQSE